MMKKIKQGGKHQDWKFLKKESNVPLAGDLINCNEVLAVKLVKTVQTYIVLHAQVLILVPSIVPRLESTPMPSVSVDQQGNYD